MVRNIIWIVVVVALVVGGWLVYKQIRGNEAMSSGTVTSRNVAPDPNDGFTSLDGNDAAAKPTPSRSDAPGTVNTEPIGAGNQTTSAAPTATTATPPGPSYTSGPLTATPVTDSQSANNPNDVRFGGTGKYAWYRQGNLTWRVNSSTGYSCIAFATMEEWAKPIVYSHGCGNA